MGLNAFTTGNPCLETILLDFSKGRDLGALKGLMGGESTSTKMTMSASVCPLDGAGAAWVGGVSALQCKETYGTRTASSMVMPVLLPTLVVVVVVKPVGHRAGSTLVLPRGALVWSPSMYAEKNAIFPCLCTTLFWS